MKWKELIKIAEAHGYRLVKHGKKHDRYYNSETGDEILNGTVLRRFAKA